MSLGTVKAELTLEDGNVTWREPASVHSFIDGYRWNPIETKIAKAALGSGCTLVDTTTKTNLHKKTVFYSVSGSLTAMDEFFTLMAKYFLGSNHHVTVMHNTVLNWEA